MEEGFFNILGISGAIFVSAILGFKLLLKLVKYTQDYKEKNTAKV